MVSSWSTIDDGGGKRAYVMGSTISTSGILLPALEPLAAIEATGSREPRGSGLGTGVTMRKFEYDSIRKSPPASEWRCETCAGS